MRPRLAAVFLLACGLACGDAVTSAPGGDPAVRQGPGEGALFIGNSLTYANDLPGLVSALAAADGGRLATTVYLPVTRAWLEAWRRDSSLPLYSSDSFHPSAMGSYLAAVAIYGVLSGRSPLGLPATLHTTSGVDVAIPAATARLLQEAAGAANAQFARP